MAQCIPATGPSAAYTAGSGATATADTGALYSTIGAGTAHTAVASASRQGRCRREVLHYWRWRCAHDRSRRHRHGGHRRNVHPPHALAPRPRLLQAPQTRQVLARRTLPLSQELRTLQMLARCIPPLALVRTRSKRDALRPLAQTLRPMQYQVGRPSHCPHFAEQGT